MGLFDDFNQFLEDRLDDFLKNNPHLELQAIVEQLREQEEDTRKLIIKLDSEEKRLQAEILSVAQEIQTWHNRVSQAKAAGRVDLANAAQEREAALLRQGNKLWGQMEGAKQRLVQAKELLAQIQKRKQEVSAQTAQTQTAQTNSRPQSDWDTSGWNQGVNYSPSKSGYDPLEQQFNNLEMDAELEEMKRNLGK